MKKVIQNALVIVGALICLLVCGLFIVYYYGAANGKAFIDAGVDIYNKTKEWLDSLIFIFK